MSDEPLPNDGSRTHPSIRGVREPTFLTSVCGRSGSPSRPPNSSKPAWSAPLKPHQVATDARQVLAQIRPGRAIGVGVSHSINRSIRDRGVRDQ